MLVKTPLDFFFFLSWVLLAFSPATSIGLSIQAQQSHLSPVVSIITCLHETTAAQQKRIMLAYIPFNNFSEIWLVQKIIQRYRLR